MNPVTNPNSSIICHVTDNLLIIWFIRIQNTNCDCNLQIATARTHTHTIGLSCYLQQYYSLYAHFSWFPKCHFASAPQSSTVFFSLYSQLTLSTNTSHYLPHLGKDSSERVVPYCCIHSLLFSKPLLSNGCCIFVCFSVVAPDVHVPMYYVRIYIKRNA
jgi:hypothetical protein